MTEYKCQECWWNGVIETEQEADIDRRCVETVETDHCPVCGKWGLVEQ